MSTAILRRFCGGSFWTAVRDETAREGLGAKARARLCAGGLAAVIACGALSSQASADDASTLRDLAFERAIALYRTGDALRFNEFFGDLLWRYSDDQRMQALLGRAVSPLSLVNAMVRRRVEDWVMRPSEVPPLSVQKPVLTEFEEQPPVLYRSEFETRADFHRRVESVRNAHAMKVRRHYETWQRTLNDYQAATQEHEMLLEREKAERAEKAVALREQLMYTALNMVMGSPILGPMQYEADREVFVGRLLSSKGNYSRKIEVAVPLQMAPDFFRNIERAKPHMSLRNNQGIWVVDSVWVEYNDERYVASWSQLPEIPDLQYKRAGEYGNPSPAGGLLGIAP